jgi:ferrochelatase
MKHGILLVNIGTPNAPDKASVRRYLAQFLADKRVIDLPAILRFSLLYGVILPTRPARAAHAYQAIWTKEGSPLLKYSQQLCQKLALHLGKNTQVALGMRYGAPSIDEALQQLKDCEQITVLPLYPQYSSAATGSTIEYVLKCLASKDMFPSLHIIRDFYQHPKYIAAQAAKIKPFLNDENYVLFSYHGLPERALQKIGCNRVCTNICPPKTAKNQACYRAQCLETSAQLANALNLKAYSTSFQSRLGRTPWIKPYTDEVLIDLRSQGVKRLVIACPSFVTDCLETLEEIGMRANEQWMALGGEAFTLVPCMNDDESWVEAIMTICHHD